MIAGLLPMRVDRCPKSSENIHKLSVSTRDCLGLMERWQIYLRGGKFTLFSNKYIKQYTKENEIKHQRITPLRPQANSEAENFMKPIRAATTSSYYEQLFELLVLEKKIGGKNCFY